MKNLELCFMLSFSRSLTDFLRLLGFGSTDRQVRWHGRLCHGVHRWKRSRIPPRRQLTHANAHQHQHTDLPHKTMMKKRKAVNLHLRRDDVASDPASFLEARRACACACAPPHPSLQISNFFEKTKVESSFSSDCWVTSLNFESNAAIANNLRAALVCGNATVERWLCIRLKSSF